MEKLFDILGEVLFNAFVIVFILIMTLAATVFTESLFFGLAFLLIAMYYFGLGLYETYKG